MEPRANSPIKARIESTIAPSAIARPAMASPRPGLPGALAREKPMPENTMPRTHMTKLRMGIQKKTTAQSARMNPATARPFDCLPVPGVCAGARSLRRWLLTGHGAPPVTGRGEESTPAFRIPPLRLPGLAAGPPMEGESGAYTARSTESSGLLALIRVIWVAVRGRGEVWSSRRPVKPEVAGSNPVVPATEDQAAQGWSSGLRGQVAQSVERCSEKAEVPGSTPGLATSPVSRLAARRGCFATLWRARAISSFAYE